MTGLCHKNDRGRCQDQRFLSSYDDAKPDDARLSELLEASSSLRTKQDLLGHGLPSRSRKSREIAHRSPPIRPLCGGSQAEFEPSRHSSSSRTPGLATMTPLAGLRWSSADRPWPGPCGEGHQLSSSDGATSQTASKSADSGFANIWFKEPPRSCSPKHSPRSRAKRCPDLLEGVCARRLSLLSGAGRWRPIHR